jgi:hypothetical protein
MELLAGTVHTMVAHATVANSMGVSAVADKGAVADKLVVVKPPSKFLRVALLLSILSEQGSHVSAPCSSVPGRQTRRNRKSASHKAGQLFVVRTFFLL